MAKLPAITSQIPNDLRRFLDRVREALDRPAQTVTSTTTKVVYQSAASPAPKNTLVPVNFTATGEVGQISLAWDEPKVGAYSYTEVWTALTNDRRTAVLLGSPKTTNFVHSLPTGGTRYYWIRFVDTNDVPGEFTSISGISATADPAYSSAQLALDLADGAATVLAAASDADTQLNINESPAWVLLKHKDANIAGTSSYSGTVRTAVGITSNGFVAGYNDPSTGNWVNSVAIDGTTGDVTILGTLKANSVIEANATLTYSGGSTTSVGAALSDIDTAVSDAASALSGLASKLDEQSEYILGSDFDLKTTNYDSGTGVGITSGGIIGKKSGATTFAIDNLGNATFKGDITGASGNFEGNIESSGYIKAAGNGINWGYGNAAVYGEATGVGVAGVAGIGSSGFSFGGYFKSSDSISIALRVSGNISHGTYNDSGTAIQHKNISGYLRLTDAASSDAYVIMANSSIAASSTGATLAAKPAAAASNTQAGWLQVKVAGVTAYIPFWL